MPGFSDARDLYYNKTGTGAPATSDQPAVAAPSQQNYNNIWRAITVDNSAPAKNYATGQTWTPEEIYSQWVAGEQARQQNAAAIRAWTQAVEKRMALQGAMRKLVFEHQNATRELSFDGNPTTGAIGYKAAFVKMSQERANEGYVFLMTRVANSALWGQGNLLEGSTDPQTQFLKDFQQMAQDMGLKDEILRWDPETQSYVPGDTTASGEYRYWSPDKTTTSADGKPMLTTDEDLTDRAGLHRLGVGQNTTPLYAMDVLTGTPKKVDTVVDRFGVWIKADKAKTSEVFDALPQATRDIVTEAAQAYKASKGKEYKGYEDDKAAWNSLIDSTIKWNAKGEENARSVTDAAQMQADGFDVETTTLQDYLNAKANRELGNLAAQAEQQAASGGTKWSGTYVERGGTSYARSGGSYGGSGGGSYGGSGGGSTSGDTATQEMIEKSDWGTAKKLLDNAMYAMRGRASTTEEVDAFLSTLNQAEEQNPSVLTATVAEDGTTTSNKKDGFSNESRVELANAQVRDDPETKVEQVGATYSNMLWNAVTAASGTSGSGQGML